MSQISRPTRLSGSPPGNTLNVERSGVSSMSDSSMRTNPSIDEPSNMMSPSSAFANCDDGISTFLLTPRMSVNCSRRKRTSCAFASLRMSALVAPDVEPEPRAAARAPTWRLAPDSWCQV